MYVALETHHRIIFTSYNSHIPSCLFPLPGSELSTFWLSSFSLLKEKRHIKHTSTNFLCKFPFKFCYSLAPRVTCQVILYLQSVLLNIYCISLHDIFGANPLSHCGGEKPAQALEMLGQKPQRSQRRKESHPRPGDLTSRMG